MQALLNMQTHTHTHCCKFLQNITFNTEVFQQIFQSSLHSWFEKLHSWFEKLSAVNMTTNAFIVARHTVCGHG